VALVKSLMRHDWMGLRTYPRGWGYFFDGDARGVTYGFHKPTVSTSFKKRADFNTKSAR